MPEAVIERFGAGLKSWEGGPGYVSRPIGSIMIQKVTAPMLAAMKARDEKITVLTAYDYPTGRMLDEAGIDVALVGDSLGMVVLGYENTLAVTMEDMLHHTAAVVRGVKRALVVADMPFMSYQISVEDAVRNAGRLIQVAGAQAVKLEGGRAVAPTIERIVSLGIPVMAHLGFTPQSIHQFGGARMQGKSDSAAERLVEDARAVQEAGAFALVLELVPSELAARITKVKSRITAPDNSNNKYHGNNA